MLVGCATGGWHWAHIRPGCSSARPRSPPSHRTFGWRVTIRACWNSDCRPRHSATAEGSHVPLQVEVSGAILVDPSVLLFCGVPLMLGSWWGLVVVPLPRWRASANGSRLECSGVPSEFSQNPVVAQTSPVPENYSRGSKLFSGRFLPKILCSIKFNHLVRCVITHGNSSQWAIPRRRMMEAITKNANTEFGE